MAQKCKITRTAEGFTYKCREDGEKKPKIEGSCHRSIDGKEGHATILGTGGGGGYTKADLKCDDTKDVEGILKEKYGEDIEIEE